MPRNSDTFWSRVLFKDFIRHFRKMSPEQIADDIAESMDALDDLNPDGDSFGSLMVRWANDRMNGAFATAARENGKKGGRPRKNPETNDQETEARQSQRAGGNSVRRVEKAITSPARSSGRRIPHPQGSFEVFDFAHLNGIPEYVANEFYQRFFAERPGTDMDGKNIDNWKGALVNYNKSKNKESA